MDFAPTLLYESKVCILNHSIILPVTAFQGRHEVQPVAVKLQRQLPCMQTSILFTVVTLANCTAPGTKQLNDFMNLLAPPETIAIYLKVQMNR